MVLLYEAGTMPLLRGAALAQADMELFMLLMAIGVPIAIISSAWTIALSVARSHNGPWASEERLRLAFLLNLFVPLVPSLWLVLVKKLGYFWL